MTGSVYQAVFEIATLLELPVVLLALAAFASVIIQCGGFVVELVGRRRRSLPTLTKTAAEVRRSLAAGDRDAAARQLETIAWSLPMARVLTDFAHRASTSDAEHDLAKQLADFDFAQQRRLNRARLLVRVGPALGLMGTLIPLSPALEGLAKGNISALTQNLRLAFSITVLGLFIGVLAYGLALFRDRIYGQDYSDLEYVAAVLTSQDAAVEAKAAR